MYSFFTLPRAPLSLNCGCLLFIARHRHLENSRVGGITLVDIVINAQVPLLPSEGNTESAARSST